MIKVKYLVPIGSKANPFTKDVCRCKLRIELSTEGTVEITELLEDIPYPLAAGTCQIKILLSIDPDAIIPRRLQSRSNTSML